MRLGLDLFVLYLHHVEKFYVPPHPAHTEISALLTISAYVEQFSTHQQFLHFIPGMSRQVLQVVMRQAYVHTVQVQVTPGIL
jgi:hypothetical protein